MNKGIKTKTQSCVLGTQAVLYCTAGTVRIGLKMVEAGSCERLDHRWFYTLNATKHALFS